MADPGGLPDEVVQTELKKILLSQTFSHSDRLRRFLRYCVEQAIAGHPENLREYVIGLEVFDRRADYSPASDPIVRVEARRLRGKLKDYYQNEGHQDPVIIDVPKGSYLPVFQSGVRGVPPRQVSRMLFLTAAVVGSACLIGIVGWIVRSEAAPRLTLSRLTADSGLTTDAAISRDGKLVAYASDRSGSGDLDIWVQQVAGGDPIQLTKEPADDHEPSFSADDAMIVFRSERTPPGVYSVAALGGNARLIALDGQDPQYSPDGKWIAYWVGSRGGDFLPPAGKVYIVPSTGGTPRQLGADFSSAAYPMWSPDGSRLLFEGARDISGKLDRDADWWTVSIHDNVVSRTGAFEILSRQHLQLPNRRRGAAWIQDRLIFAAISGDSTSLWELPLRGKAARRLTLGSSLETGPSIAFDGTIAFSSRIETTDIWSMRMNTNRGEMPSWSERLTDAAAKSMFSSSATDGSKVAYVSNKARGSGLWVKNLRTGQDLSLGHPTARYPRISHSGAMLAFLEGQVLTVIPSSGGEHRATCGDCGRPWDWSPDGMRILFVAPGSPSPVGEWTMEPSSKRILLKDGRDDLANPQFSPDGQWIGFHAIRGPTKRQIMISRYPPDGNWMAVTDGTGLDRNCAWSPGGDILYYISERDTFRCIWAQRLDSASKTPLGPPFPVAHFHSARKSLFEVSDVGAIGLSVTPDRLIFSLAEVTGNVWLARAESRP
jgi:Tol biopolymer transport system component